MSPAIRRRNRSLAWRQVEAAKLAETPDCEACGTVAVEAHNTNGDCCVSGPYDLEVVQSLCRACHDQTGCTVRRETATERKLRRRFDGIERGEWFE